MVIWSDPAGFLIERTTSSLVLHATCTLFFFVTLAQLGAWAGTMAFLQISALIPNSAKSSTASRFPPRIFNAEFKLMHHLLQ